jgi:hypothetical protein
MLFGKKIKKEEIILVEKNIKAIFAPATTLIYN